MKVSAIVPACNEAPHIEKVLSVLKETSVFEIIVVDDGSADNTAQIASKYAQVISHGEKRGKGEALDTGIRASQGDILFFCDADIEGLTPRIIEAIIEPVRTGAVEMHVGARTSKARHLGPWIFTPLLDGQRALTRRLWEQIPHKFRRGYRIETALNSFARSRSYQLFNISQKSKEDKIGFIRGKIARYAMYYCIACTVVTLYVERWFRAKGKTKVRSPFVCDRSSTRRPFQQT